MTEKAYFELLDKHLPCKIWFHWPFHVVIIIIIIIFNFFAKKIDIFSSFEILWFVLLLDMHFTIFKYLFEILNVYVSKYETEGQFWPVVHNTTIFSLIVTQIIAVVVFGIKRSPVASIFTIPLIICTLIFNEHCRRQFLPIFKNNDE